MKTTRPTPKTKRLLAAAIRKHANYIDMSAITAGQIRRFHWLWDDTFSRNLEYSEQWYMSDNPIDAAVWLEKCAESEENQKRLYFGMRSKGVVPYANKDGLGGFYEDYMYWDRLWSRQYENTTEPL